VAAVAARGAVRLLEVVGCFVVFITHQSKSKSGVSEVMVMTD
jgi:hypothetical protein